MKSFVVSTDWRGDGEMDHGWGNGYVVVEKGHPLHGKHYDYIYTTIHGGITYCGELVPNDRFIDVINDDKYIGGWIFGFDTFHWQDTKETWPKHRVEEEAERLKDILMNSEF